VCTAEIYLVRHGETEWNASGRFQGILDSALTRRGISEAQQCGRKIAPMASNFDKFLVSPLGRARQTSKIIRSSASFPPEEVDPRLREVSVGSWNGLTHVDIDACWPGALDGSSAFDWYFRSPDGERYEDAAVRARQWLDDLRGTVLAITHGLMSRIIRGRYLGLEEQDALQLPVTQGVIWRLSNGEVTAI
jgi:broad specificity phosphatase PhoE